MASQDRIDALKYQHRELDSLIQNENSRLHPDEVLVTQLKRKKLKIKDELAHLHAL
jgi:hypothetical protein